MGVGNSGIVYSKDAWERIGKSPLENAGGDMTLTNRIHALGGKRDVKMPDSEASWFYMWGGRGYHQSGMGTDDGSRPDIIKRHSAHVEEKRKAGNIPTGDIHLVPTWKHDYIQMLKEYVNKSNNNK
jgi:hypothetical protein